MTQGSREIKLHNQQHPLLLEERAIDHNAALVASLAIMLAINEGTLWKKCQVSLVWLLGAVQEGRPELTPRTQQICVIK